ncbi:MAG TPA: 5-oxoprolinase subunit PxpB [Opitutaceae bacterium]|jgi:inhibitor of KinA|nr:5-oxoprolinase subunit PxpB [Opitutaceae bacterium]
MKLEPLGDSAAVATLGSGIDEGTMAAVLEFTQTVLGAAKPGIIDVVPAYATVTVFYDPLHFPSGSADSFDAVSRFLQSCSSRPTNAPFHSDSRITELPVYYGGDHGPDMAVVAEHCGMSAEDVAALHASGDYLVYAIGFTPGFPYLGGLPKALQTPRRDTPRARVPAGSVGIGGVQTGVYSVESPGGWQIIGRTPVRLFRPLERQAALLRPGDKVRFRPISKAEFESWK